MKRFRAGNVEEIIIDCLFCEFDESSDDCCTFELSVFPMDTLLPLVLASFPKLKYVFLERERVKQRTRFSSDSVLRDPLRLAIRITTGLPIGDVLSHKALMKAKITEMF